MYQAIDAAICKAAEDSVITLIPTTRTLPIAVPPLPTETPYLNLLGSGPPVEAGIGAAIAVGLVIAASWLKLRHRTAAVRWAHRTVFAGTVAYAIVPLAGWFVLKYAQKLSAHSQPREGMDLLERVAPAFNHLSWVGDWHGNAAARSAEEIATATMMHLMGQGDAASAAEFIGWPEPVTPEGRTTTVVVLLANASAALNSDDPEAAAAWAQRAREFEPSSADARSAAWAAGVHRVLRQISNEQVAFAQHIWKETPRQGNAVDGLLVGLIARQVVRPMMADTPAAIADAFRVMESAWNRARSYAPTFMRCDYAGIIELEAWRKYHVLDDPVAAAELLERAESLVRDGELSRWLWGDVLRRRAQVELENGKASAALATLEQARRRWIGPPTDLYPDMAQVLDAIGLQQCADGLSGLALATFEQAGSYAEPSEISREGVTRARIACADLSMTRGHWEDARQHLENTKTRAGVRRDVVERLVYMEVARDFIARIAQRRSWPGVPSVTGAAITIGADGLAHTVTYYDAVGRPIGWTSLRGARREFYGPRHALFTQPGDSTPSVMLRARTGQDFDELERRRADGTVVVWLDEADDERADIELVYTKDGELQCEKAFSAKVFILLVDGVIARQNLDPGNTAPDPYIDILQNGWLVFRSRIALNSWFPVWNEGTTVRLRDDAQFADELHLRLYDADPAFHQQFGGKDDDIDDLRFRGLRDLESGFRRTTGGMAALQITVTPTGMPVGYSASFAQPETNTFREWASELPQVADIIQAAERAANQSPWQRIAVAVVSEVLAINIARGFVLQLGTALGIQAILQRMLDEREDAGREP
jgi:hypothetical protein